MDDQTTTTLPDGDITWDGETLTVGGTPLAPGTYRLAGTGARLEVVDQADDEDPPTTEE